MKRVTHLSGHTRRGFCGMTQTAADLADVLSYCNITPLFQYYKITLDTGKLYVT